MFINSFKLGFIEIPNKILLNLYAQGCSHNCEGCSNKHLQGFTNDFTKYYTNERMLSIFRKYMPLADGICWLGGDATFQFVRCLDISQMFKRVYPDKLNVLYTGNEVGTDLYTYQQYYDFDIIKAGRWTGIPVTEDNTNQYYLIHRYDKFKFDRITYKQLTEEKLKC